MISGMRKCVICDNNNINEIFRIKSFPVFMGANLIPPESYVFNDLIYGQCTKCNNLQIMDLIPLELLYQNNHNIDVVGEIWENHHIEFARFIEKTNPTTVFEIGSPSPKLFSKISNRDQLKEWYTVDLNPSSLTNEDPKYITYTGIVDGDFSFKKYNMSPPDTIAMSHVFEHLYDPKSILNILYDNLEVGNSINISVPNMEHISKMEIMPPSGLHFEHTFYLDNRNLDVLFKSCGFDIDEIYHYKNHSLFVRAIKSSNHNSVNIDDDLKANNLENINLFKSTVNKFNKIVTEINNKILNYNNKIYLYGAHFPAQYLCSMGLNMDKIVGCIDQAESKIGKKLYGINLEVFSPTVLETNEEVMVICHMGPYTDEIMERLLKLNNKIIFI